MVIMKNTGVNARPIVNWHGFIPLLGSLDRRDNSDYIRCETINHGI